MEVHHNAADEWSEALTDESAIEKECKCGAPFRGLVNVADAAGAEHQICRTRERRKHTEDEKCCEVWRQGRSYIEGKEGTR